MIEPYATTRYRCLHCRRSWSKKASALLHVERCYSNPDTKGCKLCSYRSPACCREATGECGCNGHDDCYGPDNALGIDKGQWVQGCPAFELRS